METIFNYMTVLAKYTKGLNPLTSNGAGALLFVEQFRTFDTFIYKTGLASRKFYVQGLRGVEGFNPGIYKGGNINYIGIGALAKSYSLDKLHVSGMVIGWNRLDYWRGKGEYNLKQSPKALPWAWTGHKMYENRESNY